MILQRWGRGLFSGTYDAAYAEERFRIGYRHVQIRLPQRYVIAAVQVDHAFLRDVLDREIPDEARRRQAQSSLDRIMNLDLNLICETYCDETLRELRQVNEDLRDSNRSSDRANQVKSEFLATVSHELRTPLTAIIGFSQLLGEGRVSADTVREFTVDIHASALALLTLVDEILDVARIEADRLEVRPRRLDLRALLAETMAALRVQALHKGLEFVLHIPSALPAVRADEHRLRQVLVNVIGNAVKFTDVGRIRAAHGRGHGHRYSDRSPRGRIREIRQADASHTRRHGGLGLGLAISKALLARMNGSIALSSPGRGQGTTVTMTVPVDAPTNARAAPHTPSLVVLVVHDGPTPHALATTLAAQGYLVMHLRIIAVYTRPARHHMARPRFMMKSTKAMSWWEGRRGQGARTGIDRDAGLLRRSAKERLTERAVFRAGWS